MTTAIPSPEVKIEHDEVTGKWHCEFQALDAEGKPLGRMQVIVAETQQELVQKMARNNIEAIRDMYKARNLRPDPKPTEVTVKAPTSEDDAKRQLEYSDPAQRRKAVRADVEAELGVPMETVKESIAASRRIENRLIADAWKRSHSEDYYDCGANNKIMGEYIDANNLAITPNNLEITLNAVKDQLVERPAARTVSTETPDIPAPRRSVPTGLIPGETGGSRPPAKAPGLTWAEVDALSYAEWEQKKRDPKWFALYSELTQRQPRQKQR